VIALPGVLMLLATSRRRGRWVFGVLSLLVLAGIGLSLSRTSIIGAAVALASFAAMSFSAGRRVGRILTAVFVILALAVPLAAVVVSVEGNAVFSRYANIAPESGGVSTTSSKNVSLSQIPNDVANDPFGFGLGTAGAASGFGGHTTVTLEGHGFSSETEFNFIVNELGLPGLVIWIGFTVTLLALVFRRLPRIADPDMRIGLAAVFSSVVGLTVMGFAGAFTAGTAGGPYFWFAAGIAAFWLAGPMRAADGTPVPASAVIAGGVA
jgi:O-antigen ligase